MLSGFSEKDMNNEQENKTPVAVRVYRKLRYVLATLVLLIMAAAVAQVVYVLSEYQKGDDMYRAVADSYVLPPRTPRPNQQQNATDGQGQQDQQDQQGQQGQQGEATFRPDESPDPDATPAPDSDATPAPPSEPQEFAPFSVDFDSLLAMNGECVGWISIPDTNINFPVMQAKNNSKYLDILPDGTKNSNGSIFMDCRCEPDLSDTNTVIYGHHMNSGAMFTSLEKYYGKAFFNEHRTAYYLTPNADYKITIIACMRVEADGEAYDVFGSETELRTYLSGALKNAKVSASVDVDTIDRIVTLSTCSGRTGIRTVVVGTVKRIGY